jgi:hypothetical protein
MLSRQELHKIIWALLACWISIELLYSSRWWPPNPIFLQANLGESVKSRRLKQHLETLPRPNGQTPRVWFGPYTTFPETGMVESAARRGVYDTLLTIPANGIQSNYGAYKLSAADTLFALASAHGLRGELRLAQQLNYNYFAVDLGAIHSPQRLKNLCFRSKGCFTSDDHYILWSLDHQTSISKLADELKTTSRKVALLPQISAGPTWGPLVFSPLQTKWSALNGQTLVVEAKAGRQWQLYRYGLDHYPKSVRRWLKLSPSDVTVALAPGLDHLKLCIRTIRSDQCHIVILDSNKRSAAIGQYLPEDQMSQIEILDNKQDPAISSPLMIRIKTHFPI